MSLKNETNINQKINKRLKYINEINKVIEYGNEIKILKVLSLTKLEEYQL